MVEQHLRVIMNTRTREGTITMAYDVRTIAMAYEISRVLCAVAVPQVKRGRSDYCTVLAVEHRVHGITSDVPQVS